MKRGLGKGLSQLLTELPDSQAQEAPIHAIAPNPNQPRKAFDPEALEQLADSIREHGVLQPVVVKEIEPGSYELIAGERRLRAAKMAGLAAIPIVVRSAGNQGSLELAIVENVQREGISPLEAARAYRQLIQEFGLTQDQVAAKVAKSRVAISNTLRLLKLQPSILQGLEDAKITEGHARALLQIADEALQLALYQQIIERNLSVRDVERAAQAASQIKSNRPRPAKAPKTISTEWKYLQDGMSTYFGAPVKFETAASGGKIVIEFYSDDDLGRILDVLGIHA